MGWHFPEKMGCTMAIRTSHEIKEFAHHVDVTAMLVTANLDFRIYELTASAGD
jgi:hypothetical protein